MFDFLDLIRWRPGIGDPTAVGWITVVAYFAACYLCLRAFAREKKGPTRPLTQTIPAVLRVLRKHSRNPPLPAKRAGLWLLLASIMFGLGINKQLDLQSLVTDLGRVFAYLTGVYSERRLFQVAFMLVIGGCCLVVATSLWRRTRGELRDFRLSLIGLCLLLAFIFVRASSFHGLDVFIGLSWVGLRMNAVLELSGIFLVAAGTLRSVPEKN